MTWYRRLRRQVGCFLPFMLGVVITTSIVLMLWPITTDKCDCTNGYPDEKLPPEKPVEEKHLPPILRPQNRVVEKDYEAVDDSSWGAHRLAVIVPFRDRFDELMQFAPHIHMFLNAQKIRHKIFIINQQDIYRFNRAALINVGYLESRAECDYLAMHDVDLLPLNPQLNYSYPDSHLFHVAAPTLHPKYHYPTFVGGILLVNNNHFQRLNGLSNRYWGWGREDDEFYVRIKEANIPIERPTDIHTGMDTFHHIHDRVRRPRDNRRYGNQKNAGRRRDRQTGVNTVKYKVLSTVDMTFSETPVTIVNVQLHCDLTDTPWCVTPELLPYLVAELPPEQRKAFESATKNAKTSPKPAH